MSAALPNRPTVERRHHGACVELPAIGTESAVAQAGARMFRAVSTIDRLRKDGALSARQADAGERLRTDYELGVAGARDQLGAGGNFGWYYAEARLNALRNYQDACNALGGHLLRVVEPVCLGLPAGGNVSLSDLARANGQNRQEIAGVLKLGLTVLADHYGYPP